MSTNKDSIPFVAPRSLGDSELAWYGGKPTRVNLLRAYGAGIFPWPMKGFDLPWVSPDPRAILRFDRLHIPRSLAKVRRNHPWRISINEAFERVMHACATIQRSHEEGTWITPEFKMAYTDLHHVGHAHSVEVWEGKELVGGLYGVSVQGTFAGESMFHRRSNTSKLALLHLVDHLAANGLTWIDIQMMTPVFKALGAELLERNTYLDLLEETQAQHLTVFP